MKLQPLYELYVALSHLKYIVFIYCNLLYLFNSIYPIVGVGVVLGSSNSGRTLYVEPFETVELSNSLALSRLQIKAEEGRILFRMIQAIGQA
jgi:hypothetical protein